MPFDGTADVNEQRRRLQTVKNIVAKRGYSFWEVDGLQITIDLFNPSNELSLDYHHAATTVVSLNFSPRGEGAPNIFLNRPQPSFYDLLEAIDQTD